jgi:hypothetical protein
MFIATSTYQATIGKEDTSFALYENWKSKQRPDKKTYISWQLLRKVEAPREFIAITQFENEDKRSPSRRVISACAQCGKGRTDIHSL